MRYMFYSRHTLFAAVLLIPVIVMSQFAVSLRAASIPPLKSSCSGPFWMLVGPGARINNLEQFTKAGGKLSVSGVRMARSKGTMQYWITPDMSVQNACSGWSMTTIWLGANKGNRTNLLAVTMAPIPRGSRPPSSVPPPRTCTPVRSTKYTNHILHPHQFRIEIAGYNSLRPDLSGIVLTSAWQSVNKGRYETLFAGESRTGRFVHHGMVEIITSGPCQLGPVEVATTDGRTGPLTLTKILGSSVRFTYSGGNGVLDLRTMRFTIYAVQ